MLHEHDCTAEAGPSANHDSGENGAYFPETVANIADATKIIAKTEGNFSKTAKEALVLENKFRKGVSNSSLA